MNENIDLITILKGCPKGTEFYSSLYGKVTFLRVRDDRYFPIELLYYPNSGRSEEVYFTKDGRGWYNCNGECILFPSKEQRDWSKFKRFWDEKSLNKPVTEKFDPKTLKPFDKVLVRTKLEGVWNIDLFGYKNSLFAVCLDTAINDCIPFNNETEHLLGTNDDCPEFYKWWEE